MAAINFPSSPNLNDTVTNGSTTWEWNGTAWVVKPVTSINVSSVTTTTLNADDVTTANLTVSGGVNGLNMNDLSDVNVTGASDGQYLKYVQANGKWQPATLSAGGSFNGGTITNPLVINNTTATTNATSGALRVTGGVGIGDDLYVAGTVTVEDEFLDMKASSDLRFWNSTNANYVGFSAPTNITANKIYTLPGTDGSNGQVLKTNGSGVLSWVSISSPSGGTPPGGLDKAVQFNNIGEFGGDTSFTFDIETQTVALDNLSVTSTNASTSSSTGSLVTAGGVGVAGQLNVAGATNKFTSGTASTSTLTGAIVVTGGVGVSGNINVGSTVSADTAPTDAEHLTNKRYVDANVLAFSIAFGV